MLGLEFYTECVVPKVLLLENDHLFMFYLKKLDLAKPSDMGTLIKLIITFTVFVQCYKPQTLSQ